MRKTSHLHLRAIQFRILDFRFWFDPRINLRAFTIQEVFVKAIHFYNLAKFENRGEEAGVQGAGCRGERGRGAGCRLALSAVVCVASRRVGVRGGEDGNFPMTNDQ